MCLFILAIGIARARQKSAWPTWPTILSATSGTSGEQRLDQDQRSKNRGGNAEIDPPPDRRTHDIGVLSLEPDHAPLASKLWLIEVSTCMGDQGDGTRLMAVFGFGLSAGAWDAMLETLAKVGLTDDRQYMIDSTTVRGHNQQAQKGVS